MNIMVPIGVSGRHAHVTQEHLEILFGKGYELTVFKELSQPGQYASNEKIDVISPAGRELKGVRILGPVRPATQVEVSRSDAIRGKFVAPVRPSGDIASSGKAKLVGPKGEVEIEEGVIVANRHIHLHTSDAEKFGLADKQVVTVKIEGEKGGTMAGVVARVSDKYALDFHIDTDDAAAFQLNTGDLVEVVK